MKRLLSLMMLMLLCTSAWAAPVTDVLTRDVTGVTGTSYTEWTWKSELSGAVYAGLSAGGNESIQLRTDKNNSGIVTTTSGGYVKKIVLTFEGNTGTSRYVCIYGKNSAYSSPAELYNDDTKGTLLGEIARSTDPITLTVNGDYQYIGLRSKTGALYLSEIKITWEKVATPAIEFSPATAYQGDDVTCTITCSTEGASILYALNDGEYQEYTEPFPLTETTTVYAKATLGVDESEVAQKTIEFKPTVQTVGAFPTEANTDFKFNGEAIVTYNNGKYCYIKDNTSSALLFDDSFTNSGSLVGKKITGFKGIMTLFNGLHEVININDLAYADDDPVTVTPTERTITEIMRGNLQNEFAVLRGVSITAPDNKDFTIKDGENTLQGRDNFSLGDAFPSSVEDKTFDIEGFVGIYNETIQFYPTKFTENVSEDFEVSITPDGGDYTAPVPVTIKTVNGVGDVLILYTLDGTDPYESNTAITYEAPFTLTSSCTVKAYAYYEVENVTTEARAEKTYTIELPDFTIEPSVASGTTLYKATDVTFTPKNGFGDLTIYYQINGGDMQEATETFTVNVAENTTVEITASDGYRRDFNGEFVYKVETFVPATTFKLVTDLTELEAGKQVLIAGFVEGDVNMYVMGAQAQSNNNRNAVACNLGTALTEPEATLDLANVTGYKSMVLGKDGTNYTFYDVENEGYLYAASSSSNHLKVQQTLNDNGKAAITLVDGIFSVVFQGTSTRNHMQFNPGDGLFSCYAETNSQEPVYLYVVEKTATPEIVVTEGEEAYTVTATGAGTVKLYKDGEEVENPCTVARTSEEQTFVFTATAKEEGKDISKVATQNVTVPALPATTYTITLDKEPRNDYTALVNVKATVEPALPEGATLTFKINDAEPKAYNPEKGVNMLESGTITFTATDAAGNELATKSAEYKYIMGVFGDLNGDGVVNVTEVGIIVNLILGKLNNN